MILFLHRFAKKTDYIVGRLFVDGKYLCDTLELPLINFMSQANAPDTTCIPSGVYECGIVYSPRFKRDIIEIKNVPQRTDIRIHAGNFPADSKGCILAGKNETKGALTKSGDMLDELVNMVTGAFVCGDRVLIEIV